MLMNVLVVIPLLAFENMFETWKHEHTSKLNSNN